MIPWTRIGIAAGIVLVLLLFGAYAKGVWDEAGQADVLRKQIASTALRQDELTTKSKTTEAALSAERQKTATLNKRLKDARAHESHTLCRLDSLTIGVLQDATAGSSVPR